MLSRNSRTAGLLLLGAAGVLLQANAATFVSPSATALSIVPDSIPACRVGNIPSLDAPSTMLNGLLDLSTFKNAESVLDSYRIELTTPSVSSAAGFYFDETLPPLKLVTAEDSTTEDNSTWIDLKPGSAKDVEFPEWESLWHSAAAIPISAVPEPTSVTLLGLGTLLLIARRLRHN